MIKEALIIFTKNPVPGRVKTRLAATIGNTAALSVYNWLVSHTVAITRPLLLDKFVYYLDQTTENDSWEGEIYFKNRQKGTDLGSRMKNAFAELFRKGYEKTVIVGTDCPGLTAEIISSAFRALDSTDVVIGPAEDGGYYLLGMKQQEPQLFNDMVWSTDSVLEKTKERCGALNLRYSLMPLLNDIDEEKDLLRFQKDIFKKHQLIFVLHTNEKSAGICGDASSELRHSCPLYKLIFENRGSREPSLMQNLPLPSKILYKDEFKKQYGFSTASPAIFISENGFLNEFLGEDEINNCLSTISLRNQINKKLQVHAQRYHSNI